MLVVPMLAMFSHRIPTEVRDALKTRLWQPAVASVVGFVGRAVVSAPSEPVTTDVAAAVPAVPIVAVAGQPQPALAGGGSEDQPHQNAAPSQPATAGPDAVPVPVPQPSSAAPSAATHSVASPSPAANTSSDRRRLIETSLAGLGAVAIRCEPLPGHEGMHVGSCHVPIDASGQLQRVFQAAAADPDTALAHLLDEVQAWRGRAAVRHAEDAPATRNGTTIRL